ncbi:MAG: nitrate- and nitrite sensing domain-containing protein, partial [Roseibium sp.]|nr:nitrate- and nitrite sensing domain-containing protein [Roseibium sp.]
AAQASADTKYAGEMAPFLQLTEAIEAGGLERAIGGQLFAFVANQGEVPGDRFLAYFDRLSVEKAFLNNFQQTATPAQLAAFSQTVSGEAVNQVEAWRKVLRSLPETGDG